MKTFRCVRVDRIAQTGTNPVVKGGTWFMGGRTIRVAKRDNGGYDWSSDMRGFRVQVARSNKT